MRHAFLTLVLLSVLAYAVGSAIPGCEDVLDVCQPCGDLSLGDVTISGDPRIDGTFDAVQRIRRRADGMAAAYNSGLAELMRVFEIPAADTPDVTALETAVSALFASPSVVNAVVDWTPPECFVDWHSAAEAQHSCEKRLCKVRPTNDAAWCRGYLTGACESAARGLCFEPSADVCVGSCSGACRGMAQGQCPGLCAGTCQGICDAYDAAGLCNGHCSGTCSGTCESTVPYSCGGTCTGRCETAEVDAGCMEPRSFEGSCDATALPGRCRGHLFLAGCDDNCRDCLDVAADCREMAKAEAWSGMTCDGAGPRVTLTVSADAPESDGLLLRARTLERVLRTTATDYAWLSLMVDGIDVAGAVDPDVLAMESDRTRLDNASTAYFEASNLPVDLTRGQLPLENLKARVAWLGEQALNTDGGYLLTAGVFPCVPPALTTALDILQQAVPARNIPGGSVSYSADRACTDAVPGETPCLYRLLDDLAALLALVEIGK